MSLLDLGDDPVPDGLVRGRCRICRHRLKDPVSREIGIGPECRKALNPTPRRHGVRLARIRDGGDCEGQEDLLAEEGEEEIRRRQA